MAAFHNLSSDQFQEHGSLIRPSSFSSIVGAHPTRPDADRLPDPGKISRGGNEKAPIKPWGKKNPFSDDYEG